MRMKSAIAIGAVATAVIVIVALIALPRIAERVIERRIHTEAESRDLSITTEGVSVSLSHVSLQGLCVGAPSPALDRPFACVDSLRVDLPLIATARGKGTVEAIRITGGFLDLSAEMGTPEEIRDLFEELGRRGRGAADGGEVRAPSEGGATATEETTLAVSIEAFEVRLQGQPVPLAAVWIDSGDASIGESIDVTARLRVIDLNAAPIVLDAAEHYDVQVARSVDERWSGTVEPSRPLRAHLPSPLDSLTLSVASFGFAAPVTLRATGLVLEEGARATPLFASGAVELELRAVPTSLEDLYFARAAVDGLEVDIDLDEAGRPAFLAPLFAAATGEEVEERGDDPDADPSPETDSEGLWSDRQWWEKIPQRIDIESAAVSVARVVGGDRRVLKLDGADLRYALRAIGLQMDLSVSGRTFLDGEPAGELDLSVVWGWANQVLSFNVQIDTLDLEALAVAAPAIEPAALRGALTLTARFQERPDRTIPEFSGLVGLTGFSLAVPLLRDALTLDTLSYAWSAQKRAPEDPLVFDRGDGRLGEVAFHLRPTIHGFSYSTTPFLRRIDLSIDVPEQDATSLLGRLPEPVIGPLSGARMTGTWGFGLDFGIVVVPPSEAGERSTIDILESSRFDVRDATLRLESLPLAVDVRRLNDAFDFVFRGPDDTINRRISVPPPRQLDVQLGWHGEDSGDDAPGLGAGAPDASSRWATLDEISYFLIAATLYREDGRFFRNGGINWYQWRAVLEEAWATRRLGRGASTISMQLVKNVFLSHDRSVERKLQELVLTYWMTRLVPKERILEVYFNVIEWGPQINGAVEAAEHYFGKAPSELTLAEAVWLSSIVPAPTRRGRQRESGRASDWSMRHCRDIITGMHGRGWITRDEMERGLDQEVRFVTYVAAAPPPGATEWDGDGITADGATPDDAVDPLSDLSDLRLPGDVGPRHDARPERLTTDLGARTRALIATSIPTRP